MAAYLTFGDLRPGSAAEFAVGLTLSESDVGTDALITTAIARASQTFDDLVNDHFSSLTTTTVNIDGDVTSQLILPMRCTAVTTVSTRDQAGNLTVQAAGAYRLHSSLDTAGAIRVGALDWLEIIPWGSGISGSIYGAWAWPYGPQTVEVVGTFGWTVTPGDVKRAVAMMVFDSLKNQRSDLGRASGYTTGDISMSFVPADQDHPTGIREVDQTIASYRRTGWLAVA